MKIAFLVGKFPVLSQPFIINQLTGLLDSGHDVDIYALEGPSTGLAIGFWNEPNTLNYLPKLFCYGIGEPWGSLFDMDGVIRLRWPQF